MTPPLRASLAALCLTAVCLAAATPALAQTADQRLALRMWVLRLSGTQLGLAVADMDGDGKKDLVIAHMRSTTGIERSVSVYLQGPGHERFPNHPSWTVPVPADACAFAAGNFDGRSSGVVAFLCPSRVVLVGADGAETVVLDGVDGFFDYPERGGLPVWDLVWDLEGDGAPALLVPTKEGYRVLTRRDGGPLAETSRIEVPIDQRFGPEFETELLNRFLSATSRLRRPGAVDLDGDGRLDLAVYREDGLAGFLQRPDGTFPRRPDRVERLGVVERRPTAARGAGDEDGSEAFSSVRLALDDVNGNGRADLLVTRTIGEIGLFETLRTQQLVFLGRADGTWDESSPDALINLKGVSDDPVLVDWDGDGRRDLILSSYRMDLFTNVKRAIVQTLTITYMIYRQGEDALFGADPDYTLDVSVPLEALQVRGGHRAVILEADLDGDGIRDMISRRPDGGLQVELGVMRRTFFGGARLGFDRQNPIRLAVGRTEPPWVVDLDGSGRDDLIFEPFAGDDADSRTVRVVGVPQ